MDFVTGSASSALDTGQRARLTGVDKGHAHVSASKLFEIRTQIAQGQARRSQLKRLLIAVARVVEEEQGPLALDVRAIELRPRAVARAASTLSRDAPVTVTTLSKSPAPRSKLASLTASASA